jgi:inhibitor of KinA sporulation pathway (predicted exonuclease)
LVIDFEANCSGQDQRDHEIIEFPAVLVNTLTGAIISEFHTFVNVVKTKKLSQFIKDLTHITDEQVSSGLAWQTCLQEFEAWCHKYGVTPENTTVITCGDWDLKTMLPNQLALTKTKLTDYLNRLFGYWSNVKISFSSCLKYTGLYGMEQMLDLLNLKLDGHHHSGIDDSRNIAKICQELVKRGADVTEPTQIRETKFWYADHKLPYKRNSKGDIVQN